MPAALRWGITEQESQQGKTIGICLDEIERCWPYFIGLLGDRYGWVPEHGDYRPELLRRQNWLPQHQGGTPQAIAPGHVPSASWLPVGGVFQRH